MNNPLFVFLMVEENMHGIPAVRRNPQARENDLRVMRHICDFRHPA
jgi:hypothetical protein